MSDIPEPKKTSNRSNQWLDESPLLEVRGLTKHYELPKTKFFQTPKVIKALDQVSFTLQAGKSLGVVGESGSGKSTLAKLVMALDQPTAGHVLFNGARLDTLPTEQLRILRARFQMVFQDPFGSLDPRQRIINTICEPLHVDKSLSTAQRRERAAEALAEVGLRSTDLEKYPHEFSGGQRQRIALARALITRPALIVADEPVSALDVSVQAQVLNLMQYLQERLGLSYLFISHDLAVIDLVCDDVIVLKDGAVVEQGPTDSLFSDAKHPYTRALLDAIPGCKS
jgi:ABC-type microcin C transport system duplicated ATPase subunit YejF